MTQYFSSSTNLNTLQMSMGLNYSCWLAPTASVSVLSCAGDNSYGQSVPPNSWTSSIAHVSVNQTHLCASNFGGVLKCWGDDTIRNTFPPNQSSYLVSSNCTAETFSCSVNVEKDISCWGDQSVQTPNDQALLVKC